MDPVRLALDVGPLHGHRTGVGAAVAALAAALDEHSGVDVVRRTSSASAPARSRQSAACRCRLPSPSDCGRALDWPPMDRGSARRRGDPRHELRRSAEPAATGGVGLRHVVPGPPRARATPAVRRAGEVLRRSVGAGAVVHASSTATADSVRTLLGTERVEVVHLAPLPVATDPADEHGRSTPGLGRRTPVHPRPRHAGAAQEPAPARGGIRGGRTSADAQLVLAGADGDDAAAVEDAVDALARRGAAPGACASGRSTTPPRAGCCTTPPSLAYPSLDEGFGFPILEAQPSGCPSSRPPLARSPRWAVAASSSCHPERPAMPSPPRSPASINDDARRVELVAAGTENLGRFSWASTADALVRPVPPASGERDVHDRRSPCSLAGSGQRASCAASSRSSTRSRSPPSSTPADDTVLHGLSISPDLDTITYTLAGAIDPERGWGLAGETWAGDGGPRALRRGAPDRRRRPHRRGSTSATATSPPTSTAPLASPRARRPTEVADEIRPPGVSTSGCCR